MSELGISGIGLNPYMSGLGSLGLGVGSSFGSYGDPTMMGMTGMGMGMSGLTGMSGMTGMMGMYNPSFMGQMTQAYQDIEKSQLQHASAMHNLMKQSQVDAYKSDDSALFQKSMEDAGINTQIKNLAKAIRNPEGADADGICEEYDKLKSLIYQKYSSYFRENLNRLDPADTVRGIIENMYSSIMSANQQEPVTLRSDLEKYGETAFAHGFNKNFFGKKDYHNRYSAETISYIYGTRIDNKRGKDRMEKIGGGLGKVAEGATAAAAGYGAGLGLAAIAKIWNPFSLCKSLGLKGTHTLGKIGLAAALAGDIIWQMSRD